MSEKQKFDGSSTAKITRLQHWITDYAIIYQTNSEKNKLASRQ